VQPKRPPQQQPKSRSDSAKLSLKSIAKFGCDLSEKPLKNLAKASDFQAEYEGSIPFTRSISFPAVKKLMPGQGVSRERATLA
jgi:hypothetical protein